MTPTTYLRGVRARSRARTEAAVESLASDLDRAVPIREFVVARPLVAVGVAAVAAAVATRFVSTPSRLLLRTARSLFLHRFMTELSAEA